MQNSMKKQSTAMPSATTLDRRKFFKQLGIGAAGLGLVSAFPGCYSTGGHAMSSDKLPRSRPEAQGVASQSILEFLAAINASKHEFHSFMMVRHGHVIAEGWWAPYRPQANHMLYSLSKSFTSTAVGFAVCEGKLDVDALVTSFFPDKLPEQVSANLATMRVKHLLTMSVGREKDSAPRMRNEQDWARAFLSLPVENPPGSVFLYDSGASYMLSAIVQKLTGQRVIDYLRPRLFEPLEIEGITWETCPLGINTGGWGLSVPTGALAKFGQLYLQEGQWKGETALPAVWIREATTFKIQQPATGGADLDHLKETSDWHQGYCYQFWRCRHNGFRGDGAMGQYCIVLPDEDAVIAITSETADMQGELNLVWKHLLPAMRNGALPSDRHTDAELRRTLASLALPLPAGVPASSAEVRVSGRTFRVEPNSMGVEGVSFNFQGDGCTFVLTELGGRHEIRCGTGRWVEGVTDMPGTPPKLTTGDLRPAKIAAGGAWKDAMTYVMTWRFYETAHHDTVTCHFDGSSVGVEFMSSIAEKSPSHPETRPVLQGRI
jgi:CubicO group peptidase (beta-lactamase class C family)